jgi:hypothetical protein
MKLSNPFKNFEPLEYALLAAFIVYIILPVSMPAFISTIINNPVGYIVLFLIAIFLFFYSHAILAIVFIIVAYELLRRSSNKRASAVESRLTPRPMPAVAVHKERRVHFNEKPLVDDKAPAYNAVPTRPNKDEEVAVSSSSIEEDAVLHMKQKSGVNTGMVESSFKPVYDEINGASSYV